MKCPHCELETEMPYIPAKYIDRYHTKCIAAMPCCGVGVVLKPVTTISVELYKGEETVDEWGHEMFVSDKVQGE